MEKNQNDPQLPGPYHKNKRSKSKACNSHDTNRSIRTCATTSRYQAQRKEPLQQTNSCSDACPKHTSITIAHASPPSGSGITITADKAIEQSKQNTSNQTTNLCHICIASGVTLSNRATQVPQVNKNNPLLGPPKLGTYMYWGDAGDCDEPENYGYEQDEEQ